MPNQTPSRLTPLIAKDIENILDKAALRTQEFKEKFFPAVAEDTRPDAVKKYETDVYDNPKAIGYGNMAAAVAYMAVQGISEFTLTHEHQLTRSVDAVRGVVIVPVDGRNWKWADHNKDVKVGQPYICVTEHKAGYRNAADELVYLTFLTSTNCRPATEAEQAAVVTALMQSNPARTMRNLGNALDGVTKLDE